MLERPHGSAELLAHAMLRAHEIRLLCFAAFRAKEPVPATSMVLPQRNSRRPSAPDFRVQRNSRDRRRRENRIVTVIYRGKHIVHSLQCPDLNHVERLVDLGRPIPLIFTSTARLVLALFLALALFLGLVTAAAQAQQVGKVSGLPLPRFVSLKSDRVNLREGPSKDHRTTWVFERAGLPVEITAEFETWRKVRDSDGTEGWVLHSLLSGRRTALVAPWKKDQIFTLFAKPSAGAAPTARLQPGVIANIKTCDGSWCRVFGDGFDGFIQQTDLWGVYPNEKIE